jgi:hypothetical protein
LQIIEATIRHKGRRIGFLKFDRPGDCLIMDTMCARLLLGILVARSTVARMEAAAMLADLASPLMMAC